jgi:hypothetical protein
MVPCTRFHLMLLEYLILCLYQVTVPEDFCFSMILCLGSWLQGDNVELCVAV